MSPGLERGIGQQPPVEALVGRRRRAIDQLVERARHPAMACGRSGAQTISLASMRVVVERDLVARPRPRRPSARPGPPGTRRYSIRPVEGRNPLAGSSLVMRHSMAQPRGLSQPAGTRMGSPGGDPELLPHQVHAVDQLGHRVLDLDPGVHLEEVERAGPGASRNSQVPAPR